MRLQDFPALQQMRAMSGGVDPKKKQLYEELRRTGSMLLQQGEIDELTYRTKLRDAGVELNLIGKDEFPDRLPTGVETGLEIAGGITGAIIGAPSIGGAAIGAGVGAGAGSLVADYLADYLNPNVPSPSTQKRFKDAAQIGLIDTALTAAVPVFGKGLATVGRAAMGRGKTVGQRIADAGQARVEGMNPDDATEQSASVLNKLLGVTKEAEQSAKVLQQSGRNIPLAVGQATANPIIRATYEAMGRMPFIGGPAQKQMKETQARVLDVLQDMGAGSKKYTEVQRGNIIKGAGSATVRAKIKEADDFYKMGDELNAARGEYFDLNPLRETFKLWEKNNVVAARNMPEDFTGLKQFFATVPENELVDINIVQQLRDAIGDLLVNYNPTRTASAVGTGQKTRLYNLSGRLKTTFDEQYKKDGSEAAKQYQLGDEVYKDYKNILDTEVGKQFVATTGRAEFRPGFKQETLKRVDSLYKRINKKNDSVEAVRELRKLTNNKKVMNALAGNHLDDLFNRRLIGGEKLEFDALFKDLGFDNPRGGRYQATKELFKDYENVDIDELEVFLKALQTLPEAVPNVNQFVVRSAGLRLASSLGPGALFGAVGVGAGAVGGPIGSAAGVGLMWALNKFLSKPISFRAGETVGEEAVAATLKGLNKAQEKEFMQKFVAYLNRLTDAMPSAPTGAIPIQTVVPMLDDQFQQSNVPMLQEQNVGQAMRP